VSADTPAWVREAIFYQVFPDRFASSDRVHKPGRLQPWDAPPTFDGFKGGDLRGVTEHLGYLEDLGITALYVTHDQEEALSISDRVVVLSQGQIEQVGVPAEIYGNPATLFVAEFIGTMNRVCGSVAPGGAGLVDADGAMLPVEEAAQLPAGRRVVVLIRPESIELETQGTDVAPQRPLAGRVTAHTFLGAVTRLSIQTPVASIFADIPTTRALALGIGTAVTLGWDPAAPRLINLADDESSTIEELAASYSA